MVIKLDDSRKKEKKKGGRGNGVNEANGKDTPPPDRRERRQTGTARIDAPNLAGGERGFIASFIAAGGGEIVGVLERKTGGGGFEGWESERGGKKVPVRPIPQGGERVRVLALVGKGNELPPISWMKGRPAPHLRVLHGGKP